VKSRLVLALLATSCAGPAAPRVVASLDDKGTAYGVAAEIRLARGVAPNQVVLSAVVADSAAAALSCRWHVPSGRLSALQGTRVTWQPDGNPGVFNEVPCTLSLHRGEVAIGHVVRILQVRADGTLVQPNVAPEIAAVSATTLPGGRSITLRALGQDEDGDPLSWNWRPLRGVISGEGPRANWTPSGPVPDAEMILVQVSDGWGGRAARLLALGTAELAGIADGTDRPGSLGPLRHEWIDWLAPPVVRGIRITTPGPAPVRLDAPEDDGQASGEFEAEARLGAVVVGDGQIPVPWVLWASERPDVLGIDWMGRIRALPGAPEGNFVVTARSFVDPSVSASVSITVRHRGAIRLEVM